MSREPNTQSSNLLKLIIGAGRAYVRLASPVSYLSRRFIAGLDAKKLELPITSELCIDVGAGTAPYEQDLRRALGVLRYITVDIAPSDRTQVVAEGAHLPFAAGKCDLVVMFEVIQHVEDTGKLLGEIARVLRPGGHFLVTFPFVYPECGVQDLHRWTLDGMECALSRRGLEPLVAARRGGLFFAIACALNWAMQHLDPGQRRSWRGDRSMLGVLRTAIFTLITIPTTVAAWLGLGLDRILPSSGCYIGGAILARRQSKKIAANETSDDFNIETRPPCRRP